ncbi:pancreatic lipase-related protein 2-like [Nasonia vitripennis]|uniref:phospholipase A1 n=1 Tax=Nasonia vitripennis TaxID=7425 RepID=A0A7M7QTZ7_NASVI|nr:pancreatic lipase-related protein 2-like [Nasonia vitripennis]
MKEFSARSAFGTNERSKNKTAENRRRLPKTPKVKANRAVTSSCIKREALFRSDHDSDRWNRSICYTVNSEEYPKRLVICQPHKLTYQKFHLHIHLSSRKKAFQLIQDDPKVSPTAMNFDLRHRTVVIVHGFMGHPRRLLMQNLANQLLTWLSYCSKNEDINVLHIDWSDGCSQIFQYYQAAVNAEYAGIRIKEFFRQLKTNWIENAELLRIEENLLIDRVTGLDPAEICFEDDGIPIRLSKKNARFVDAIHTDAIHTKNDGFGIRDPIGHVDFYVNGGSTQPGCDRREIFFVYGDVLDIIAHMLKNVGCHRIRAAQVFTYSLEQTKSNQCKYWAHPWNLSSNQAETHRVLSKPCNASVCPEMGINADLYDYQNTETNTFYVATTSSVPFCARLS